MNKKFNVMNQRPQASDEEIKGFMDFKSVLNQHDQQIKLIKRTSLIKKIIVSSVLVVTVATILWIVQSNEQTSVTASQLKEESPTSDELNVAETKTETTQTPAGQSQSTNPTSSKKPSNAAEIKKVEPKPESTSVQPVTEDEKNIEASYVQAEPVHGYPELYEYFSKNLIYPKEAVKDSIQGVSTVTFIINKDGAAEKVEVVNSLGQPFDKEIARLIESMPAWKSAFLNGKPVPSKISLPITFQIQKVKSK